MTQYAVDYLNRGIKVGFLPHPPPPPPPPPFSAPLSSLEVILLTYSNRCVN